MKLTVDLSDPKDVQDAQFLLEGVQREGGYTTEPTVTTETPAITATPEDRKDPENPEIPEVDSLGMVHNEEYHQTPPALNKDGTFKAKRGQKDAHAAAVATHKAGITETTPEAVEEPAPAAGMPGMPGAAPDVQVPDRVIGYEEVCQRFTGLMASGAIADFNPIYEEAGIPKLENGQFNAVMLQTDETLRRSLWDIMDRIEADS